MLLARTLPDDGVHHILRKNVGYEYLFLLVAWLLSIDKNRQTRIDYPNVHETTDNREDIDFFSFQFVISDECQYKRNKVLCCEVISQPTS